MREFLTDFAGREYDARVESSGAFTTYKSLEEWLLEHYSTIDPINTYRDRFFGCYQKEHESFDDYFQRFRTAQNALDVPPPVTTAPFTSLSLIFSSNTALKFVLTKTLLAIRNGHP